MITKWFLTRMQIIRCFQNCWKRMYMIGRWCSPYYVCSYYLQWGPLLCCLSDFRDILRYLDISIILVVIVVAKVNWQLPLFNVLNVLFAKNIKTNLFTNSFYHCTWSRFPFHFLRVPYTTNSIRFVVFSVQPTKVLKDLLISFVAQLSSRKELFKV